MSPVAAETASALSAAVPPPLFELGFPPVVEVVLGGGGGGAALVEGDPLLEPPHAESSAAMQRAPDAKSGIRLTRQSMVSVL
jgi:hypothetical protein